MALRYVNRGVAASAIGAVAAELFLLMRLILTVGGLSTGFASLTHKAGRFLQVIYSERMSALKTSPFRGMSASKIRLKERASVTSSPTRRLLLGNPSTATR